MPLPASNSTKAGRRRNAQFEMHRFKHGEMHSGSAKGPVVKNRQQAIAIMLHETGQSAGQRSTRHKSTMPIGRGKNTLV